MYITPRRECMPISMIPCPTTTYYNFFILKIYIL